MPYIDAQSREDLEEALWAFNRTLVFEDPGELNYVITSILLNTKPRRYTDYNRLIGVLECVKLELYRRAVAPYEDKKCAENGDVYP